MQRLRELLGELEFQRKKTLIISNKITSPCSGCKPSFILKISMKVFISSEIFLISEGSLAKKRVFSSQFPFRVDFLVSSSSKLLLSSFRASYSCLIKDRSSSFKIVSSSSRETFLIFSRVCFTSLILREFFRGN